MKTIDKIKTVIADDEKLARSRIRRLLQHDVNIFIDSECSNGLEVLEILSKKKIDLLFLDIQMPELNGFEVLEQLDRQNLPAIIFVTAYDKYAVKAFEVHALDYLLKPFDDERFFSALDNAKKQLKNREEDSSHKMLELLRDTAENRKRYADKLVVKSSGRIYFIKTKDICRIKSAGKYLEIFADNKLHVMRKTMSEIEKTLDPSEFIRIHRSVILNLDHINELQYWQKNEYVFLLKNGEKFTSSSTYRKNLDKILGNQ